MYIMYYVVNSSFTSTSDLLNAVAPKKLCFWNGLELGSKWPPAPGRKVMPTWRSWFLVEFIVNIYLYSKCVYIYVYLIINNIYSKYI